MPVRETTSPIPRSAFDAASSRLKSFPILTITGPRQSGKTTLSRLLAPHLPYLTLEDPDTRAYASEDPRGFLRQVHEGAILDEVQRCPSLFSYLQGVVDAEKRFGQFILTGSSQFDLIQSIEASVEAQVGSCCNAVGEDAEQSGQTGFYDLDYVCVCASVVRLPV